jgi:hypothetical protein
MTASEIDAYSSVAVPTDLDFPREGLRQLQARPLEMYRGAERSQER